MLKIYGENTGIIILHKKTIVMYLRWMLVSTIFLLSRYRLFLSYWQYILCQWFQPYAR